LATYPVIYYLVAYIPRYGEPVRWVLLLLAGAGVMGAAQLGAMDSPYGIDEEKHQDRNVGVAGTDQVSILGRPMGPAIFRHSFQENE
jgi:hypothetical protein